MKHSQTGALFMNGTGVLNLWLGIIVKKTTMVDYTGNKHNQFGALFMNGTGVLNLWLGMTVKKTTMADSE